MEVSKLFEDSFKYPARDWNKLLIFGVIILISGFYTILDIILQVSEPLSYNFVLEGIILMFSLLSIIFSLITLGYSLSITRKTINLEKEIPDFEWSENLSNGFKVFILEIAYLTIPFIVTLIVAYLTGVLNYLTEIASYLIDYGVYYTISYLPFLDMPSNLSIVIFIGSILFIIFESLAIIASARLAETDNLNEAINIKDTINKIDEIGWTNYIIWTIAVLAIFTTLTITMSIVLIIIDLIIMTIINTAASFIITLIIYSIIGFLIIGPYVQMSLQRALGLLYNESKKLYC